MHLRITAPPGTSATQGVHRAKMEVTPEAIELADPLVCEVILLSVAMSMLNARVASRVVRPGSDLQRYYPNRRFHAVVAEHTRRQPNFFFSQALTKHLERLALDMAALADVWPKSMEMWTAHPAENKEYWQRTSTQVRSACSSARILLLVIGDRLVQHLDGFAGKLVEADHLLRAVLKGATPCVRSDGVVIVPLIDDRRRERRVNFDERVDLLCDRGSFRPRLKDISMSGVGLIEAPSIAVGTQIAIRLASNRLMAGMVRWSHGGNIGATWLKPLEEDDELFLNAWHAVSQR